MERSSSSLASHQEAWSWTLDGPANPPRGKPKSILSLLRLRLHCDFMNSIRKATLFATCPSYATHPACKSYHQLQHKMSDSFTNHNLPNDHSNVPPQTFLPDNPQPDIQNHTFQPSPIHPSPQFQPQFQPQPTNQIPSAFAPPSQPPTPHSRSDDPQFDIFDWFPKYQSCQRYFIDHAQQSAPVQAVAAFINIQLPFQRTPPITSSQTRLPPSPSGAGLGSLNFSSTARSPGGANPTPSNLAFTSISLIPYLRRLVVTGLDFPGVLHGFFGDDWTSGVGALHEQERRNYLFAAKSGGWASVKKDYDMGSAETVPFMRPLQGAVGQEIEAAEKTWSEWLAMEDWVVGPRAPEGLQRPSGPQGQGPMQGQSFGASGERSGDEGGRAV
ncbi:MAG: hypothetical protein Q9169_006254 [Polycauliona sp. 2 TL-2023]